MVGLVAWSFAKAFESFLLAAVSAAFVAVSARFAEVSCWSTAVSLAATRAERCSQAVDGAGWCREDCVSSAEQFATSRCL